MKNRRRAGFTLAETLITVALLGIIFAAITGGLVAFEKAYSKVTRKANAQVMLSTAIMEISNDLKGAETYYTDNSAFYTTARGYAIQYVRNTDDDTIGLEAVPYKVDGFQNIPLLTSKTNTDGLIVDISDFSYDQNTNLFTVTVLIRPNDKTGESVESQTIIVRPNKAQLDIAEN